MRRVMKMFRPIGDETTLRMVRPIGDEITLRMFRLIRGEITLRMVRPIGGEIILKMVRPIGGERVLDLQRRKEIQYTWAGTAWRRNLWGGCLNALAASSTYLWNLWNSELLTFDPLFYIEPMKYWIIKLWLFGPFKMLNPCHSICRASVAVRICEPQFITSLSGCLRVQFRMSAAPVYGCHI